MLRSEQRLFFYHPKKTKEMNSSSNSDRFQVVSDSFRNDSLSTTEDIWGVGKARPNLEAVDFAPKKFDRRK